MKDTLNTEIDAYIKSINDALAVVNRLVKGNTLFRDGQGVSQQGRAEAAEALAQFAAYVAELDSQKAKAQALLVVEMPQLPPQFASDEVIAEFKAWVADLQQAADQYQPPVEVPLQTDLEAKTDG